MSTAPTHPPLDLDPTPATPIVLGTMAWGSVPPPPPDADPGAGPEGPAGAAQAEAETGASRAAANIVALTQYDGPALFVEGTSSADMDNSDALPAIWENPDDFGAKFAALTEAAAGSPEAVAGGQESIGPVLQKLGGACKACHDDYRQAD